MSCLLWKMAFSGISKIICWGGVHLRGRCEKLLHNIICKGMKSADFSWNAQALIDVLLQFSNRLVGIGDHNDLAGVDTLFILEILYLRRHGCRLSRISTSHQKAVIIICDHCATLFSIQLYLWVNLF